jgi:cytochrome c nitrite reductase small subunit
MSTQKTSIQAKVLLALTLAGTLGLFAGVGTYTFYYGQGHSYLSNDPKACMNCHIMREQYDGWQKAAHHANATCNDCHTPKGFFAKYLSKAENGFWHSKGFTLQDFHEPIMIKPHNSTILQANCVRCHSELVAEINTHAGIDGKMLDCVHCHKEVGHGPVR